MEKGQTLNWTMPEVLEDIPEILLEVPEILDQVPMSLSNNGLVHESEMGLFLDYINWQLSRSENVFILIEGRTQMGKSSMAIHIAQGLGRYDLVYVVFTIDQFRKLIDSNPPEGTVIIYDDPQIEFNAQDWQKNSVKQLTRISQTMGNRHYVVIMTTPSMRSIPSQMAWLVTIYLQGDDFQKGLFKTKRPIRKQNVTFKNADIYYSYLKLKIPGTRKSITLKQIKSGPLPASVYMPYNQKKEAALSVTLYKEKEEKPKPKRKINPNSLKNLKPFQKKGKSTPKKKSKGKSKPDSDNP